MVCIDYKIGPFPYTFGDKSFVLLFGRNPAAETYAISLMLKYNSPPKMSDPKLQRKIWYVNGVELLLPRTESEPNRLKCSRVQKLLRLWVGVLVVII